MQNHDFLTWTTTRDMRKLYNIILQPGRQKKEANQPRLPGYFSTPTEPGDVYNCFDEQICPGGTRNWSLLFILFVLYFDLVSMLDMLAIPLS